MYSFYIYTNLNIQKMSSDLTKLGFVRPVKQSDYTAIEVLHDTIFAKNTIPLPAIDELRGYVLIMKETNEILGYLLYKFVVNRTCLFFTNKTCNIAVIGIKPHYRRGRLGTMLLKQLLKDMNSNYGIQVSVPRSKQDDLISFFTVFHFVSEETTSKHTTLYLRKNF
jgi:ribosomal protein S18 acetylase RimI-like enzyme